MKYARGMCELTGKILGGLIWRVRVSRKGQLLRKKAIPQYSSRCNAVFKIRCRTLRGDCILKGSSPVGTT